MNKMFIAEDWKFEFLRLFFFELQYTIKIILSEYKTHHMQDDH